MYIDTHTHLNFEAFEKDCLEVVKQAKANGVAKMIVVGVDLESSQKAIELAEKVEGVFAAVGFHPHHCKGIEDAGEMIMKLRKLAKSKKVVAIGECGLDYHVYQKTKYVKAKITEEQKNLQKQVFGRQVQLAKELSLPVIIHNREAQKEILDVLDHFCKNDGRYPEGVFHCISGSKKYLKKLLEGGFYIGVDGNVTYSGEVQMLVRETPLNRLLLETDSPWLTPVPYRGLRNTPSSVKIVAESVAGLKEVLISQVEAKTTKNAEILFKI